MARLPNPQLAQQWRERHERFDHSELTIAEFCELEGYSTASFYQWRRKLRSGEPQVAPAFVPVDFKPGDLVGRVQRGVEIDLPGGAIVRIPVGATTADQRKVIEAVVQATSAEVGS